MKLMKRFLRKMYFSKVIYRKEYTSPTRWGETIHSYVSITFYFDLADGVRYIVKVPNFSCTTKTKQEALTVVIEHESIGNAKYQQLKELLYDKSLWNKIC